jgi:flagellar hook protein FlgE
MSGSESAVSAMSQDGYPLGEISAIDVDTDGVITGTYTNGEEIVLGQVVLATFASEAGLERLGGNMFQATAASGDPAVGAPGSGGRGDLYSYALESSNVELEDEFVNMITSQRGYQAAARVISTADETLQELVNLV